MARRVRKAEKPKKNRKKPGLPPGTLVLVGEKRLEEANISVFSYDAEEIERHVLSEAEELREFRSVEGQGVDWINIVGLHDIQMLETVGRIYGIDPLTLEDVLNTKHRPKIEEFSDYTCVILRMIFHADDDAAPQNEHVAFVFGNGFLISFQEQQGDVFGPIRSRLEQGRARIRSGGADYLLYAILDAIVDHYLLIIDDLNEPIEAAEEAAMLHASQSTLESIVELQRETRTLRKAISPAREVLRALEKSEASFFNESTLVYLNDVSEHLVQGIEELDQFRDRITNMLSVYVSFVGQRTNEVMQVLTVLAAIFIPLTFIAGIYGMNFESMPELKWPYGYPSVLGLMMAVAFAMFLFFKRKKWI